MKYLHLLTVHLGLELLEVIAVMTSFDDAFLKPQMEKILHLKKNAKSPFFRTLAKSLACSSFGYHLLKVESFSENRLAIGPTQMRRILWNPRLQSFKLLGPHCLMAKVTRLEIRYSSLLFVGVVIMSAAKEFFIRSYYLSIKPKLTACLGIFKTPLKITVLYVDTDCLNFEVIAPSFSSCNQLLRQSDLLYAIKEFVDFGPFLQFPQCRVLREIKGRLDDEQFQSFLHDAELKNNQAGLFKVEHKLCSDSATIQLFYSVRTKAYVCLVSLKEIGEPPQDYLKKSLKGILSQNSF